MIMRCRIDHTGLQFVTGQQSDMSFKTVGWNKLKTCLDDNAGHDNVELN